VRTRFPQCIVKRYPHNTRSVPDQCLGNLADLAKSAWSKLAVGRGGRSLPQSRPGLARDCRRPNPMGERKERGRAHQHGPS
jgi:hypothetical protein